MTEESNPNDGEEEFVFLNFKGRVPKEILQEKVFLKIANLHKKHPLIQVNDLLFKGTHDYAIGTNIFYIQQKNDAPPPAFPFEKHFSTKLKLVTTETKVINCQQMKLKPKKAVLPEGSENVKFNLNWTYEEILKKFEDGSLDMNDMIDKEVTTPDLEEIAKKIDKSLPEDQETSTELKEDNSNKPTEPMELERDSANTSKAVNSSLITDADMAVLENIPEVQILEKGYNKLLELAKIPMRMRKEEENVAPCEDRFKMAYNYRNIECKVLQPPAFPVNNKVDVTEENLWSFIDLQRCELFGFIKSDGSFPRTLTDEEKRKLLVLENMDMLSLQVRYIVIQAQIEKLEKFLETLSVEKLTKIDEFGYTPEETLYIYKKLAKSLAKKLKDIQTSEPDT